MRYATESTPRLMWFNFAHLFSVSLLPLSTAWMAKSELAPQPVAFYAAVFFLVNATYIRLTHELIDRAPVDDASPSERRIMHFRSIATLCIFGVAALVALKYPLIGLGRCTGSLAPLPATIRLRRLLADPDTSNPYTAASRRDRSLCRRSLRDHSLCGLRGRSPPGQAVRRAFRRFPCRRHGKSPG
jgi:hypothetical protein